jgi:phosphoribosyl 1,2-cyclic phosphodiesterase
VEAILVTHEHSDHNRGARVLARRLKVPVYATAGTLERTELAVDVVSHVLKSGEAGTVGPFDVLPFNTPHDAAEPVGFILGAQGLKVGVVTDLGYCTELVKERLSGVDALVIEANHDEKMLMEGPYPWFLKQRVKSRTGHLSNLAAAELLGSQSHTGLQHVVLAHLSEVNNDPALAGDVARSAGGIRGNGTRVAVARQAAPLPVIVVEK